MNQNIWAVNFARFLLHFFNYKNIIFRTEELKYDKFRHSVLVLKVEYAELNTSACYNFKLTIGRIRFMVEAVKF